MKVPSGPTATDRRALLSSAGLPLEHRLRGGGRLAPSLLATARLLAAPPALLRQLRSLPPAELKARLFRPQEPPDAEQAALRLLAAAVGALLQSAVGCAGRLREEQRAGVVHAGGVAEEAAAVQQQPHQQQAGADSGEDAAAGAGATSSGVTVAELRHFARVYVDGLVRILEGALTATGGASA
jgi:hypothetical protein